MSSTIIFAISGGTLIGLTAVLMLLLSGRITGISGMLAHVLENHALKAKRRISWQLLFLAGLALGTLLTHELIELPHPPPSAYGWSMALAAGFLVGFGTRLGSGCTSGHGVCGIGRLSRRSMTATLIFMSVGMITVYITRHVL